ncbi:MAG: hypothetical protein AAF495_00620 [Pseudomonadota bacterium]
MWKFTLPAIALSLAMAVTAGAHEVGTSDVGGGDSCDALHDAELERFMAVRRELEAERIDALTEHKNALLLCKKQDGNSTACRKDAQKKYEDKMTDIQIQYNVASGEHQKQYNENQAKCRAGKPDLQPPMQAKEDKPPTVAEVRKKLPPAWYYNPDPVNYPGAEFYERITPDNTHIYIKGPDVYLFPKTLNGAIDRYTLLPKTIEAAAASGQAGVTLRAAHAKYKPKHGAILQEKRGILWQDIQTSPPTNVGN